MTRKPDPPDEWLEQMAQRWLASSDYDQSRLSMACEELLMRRAIVQAGSREELMRTYRFKHNLGGGGIATAYDLDDMIQAWSTDGQGHAEAVARGRDCIIVDVDDEAYAAKLARTFSEDFFNIPTCTHWDGQTLSLYCGDAGRGAAALIQRTYAWLDGLMLFPIQGVTRS